MGLIKILTDTGSVKAMKAKPVFSNEPFEIELGSNGFVKHGICKDGKKGKRIGAYSIAILNDGTNHVEWMYEEELMDIRKRSESVKADKATPWKTDEDEMCRKTVVKRHYKYLPKTERAIMAAQAIAFDDENNGIDFKKEQEEAERLKNTNIPGSTPEAPTGDALATDEDFETLERILSNPLFGTHFPSPNAKNMLVETVRKGIAKHKAAGTFLKDKAEEYIKWLTYEESLLEEPVEA